MKKIIIICILIIILILLTLLGIFFISNKELSKDEFFALEKNLESVQNVKIESSIITKYIKDNYISSIRNDGVYTWTNTETKESILYVPSQKIYSLTPYVEEDAEEWKTADYTFIRL